MGLYLNPRRRRWSWVRRWGTPGSRGRMGAVRSSVWIWLFSCTRGDHGRIKGVSVRDVPLVPKIINRAGEIRVRDIGSPNS